MSSKPAILLILFVLLPLVCSGTRSRCRKICRPTLRQARSDCKKPGAVRCFIRRCTSRKNCTSRNCKSAFRGWRCAPLPSITPVPSTSPSPSLPTSRSPFQPVRGRAKRTFRVHDDGREQFDVNYDVTLTDAGVISLADAKTFIRKVTCSQDGSVRIKLKKNFKPPELALLYPVGALLVISADVFGPCKLSPGNASTDPFLNRALFEDSFLFIEYVQGTTRNALIRGKPTTYFSLFSKADIRVKRINTATSRQVTIALPASRETSVALRRKFKLDLFSVTASVKATDKGGFQVLEAKWDEDGIDVQVKVASELTIAASLSLKFGKGDLLKKEKMFEFISVPLYAIPNIPVLTDLLDLPSLKLGVYLEAPIVLSVEANLEATVSATAKIEYSTGRKEQVYFIKGPLRKIRAGVRLVKDERSSATSSLTPQVLGGDTPPTELKITAFAGLQPQLVLYCTLLTASLSVKTGVEVSAMASAAAFKPVPARKRSSGIRFGDCDTCHFVQLTADAVITGAKIDGKVGIAAEASFFGFDIELLKFEVELQKSPNLSIELAKACFFKEFGRDTKTCGMICCDRSKDEVCKLDSASPPMGTCSGSPSPSPVSSPSLRPSPSATPGRRSSCYTDPHLRTFDGLTYDCQASGEFTLVTSRDRQFEVQTRFSGRNPTGSVTTGVAVSFDSAPVVQVSIAVNDASPSTRIRNCPVLLYVDGSSRDVLSGSGQNGEVIVEASASTGRFNILYTAIGASVSFRVQTSVFFGCYFEAVSVFLPETFINDNTITGLLGSPNGDISDEWMKKDGSPLPAPRTVAERLFKVAYDYCIANWCIKNEAKSLFTYENGSSHASFDKCNRPYTSPPDLSSASPALRALCGTDKACLIDGIVGDIEDAENTLNVQAEVDRSTSSSSIFQFDPPLVAVESAENIRITLDVSDFSAEQVRNLQQFQVFRVNSDTGALASSLSVVLEDNGLAINSDDDPGDLIFSNILALRSENAGEVFAFRAFPVINGSLNRSSALVFTALNAVRSYSIRSGIGGGSSKTTSVTVGSLSGLELLVRYSWEPTERDLDTGTTFIGTTVGFNCGPPSQYIRFSGDDTSTGGTETIVVSLGMARADKQWNRSTIVDFNAGWYNRESSSPATLRMSLRDISSGTEVPQTGLALVISPGTQTGCSTTLVAQLAITVRDEVTLVLKSSRT